MEEKFAQKTAKTAKQNAKDFGVNGEMWGD